MHYGNAETATPLLALWIALVAALTVSTFGWGGAIGAAAVAGFFRHAPRVSHPQPAPTP